MSDEMPEYKSIGNAIECPRCAELENTLLQQPFLKECKQLREQCAEKDREIAVAESQMEIMAKEVFTARAKLQIAREALECFAESGYIVALKALEQIGEI